MKEDSQPLIALHYRAGDYLEHEKSNHPIFVPPSIDAISQKIDSIVKHLKNKKKILFLTTSNRWEGDKEKPKSTLLAEHIKSEVGDKVEIIICDIRSYLAAMFYMASFNSISSSSSPARSAPL